jgi:hypothetical protein
VAGGVVTDGLIAEMVRSEAEQALAEWRLSRNLADLRRARRLLSELSRADRHDGTEWDGHRQDRRGARAGEP